MSFSSPPRLYMSVLALFSATKKSIKSFKKTLPPQKSPSSPKRVLKRYWENEDVQSLLRHLCDVRTVWIKRTTAFSLTHPQLPFVNLHSSGGKHKENSLRSRPQNSYKIFFPTNLSWSSSQQNFFLSLLVKTQASGAWRTFSKATFTFPFHLKMCIQKKEVSTLSQSETVGNQRWQMSYLEPLGELHISSLPRRRCLFFSSSLSHLQNLSSFLSPPILITLVPPEFTSQVTTLYNCLTPSVF